MTSTEDALKLAQELDAIEVEHSQRCMAWMVKGFDCECPVQRVKPLCSSAASDIRDLVEQMQFTYCAYCGHTEPADDESAPAISEHIKTCADHPMRAVERELDAAVKHAESLIEQRSATEARLKAVEELPEKWRREAATARGISPSDVPSNMEAAGRRFAANYCAGQLDAILSAKRVQDAHGQS